MSRDNRVLAQWVQDIAEHTKPANVHWCTGDGRRVRSSSPTWSRSGRSSRSTHRRIRAAFLHRSDPTDVARTEHLTFICTHERGRRGPDQQLDEPGATRTQRVWPLFAGAMQGRTMYVVPYLMGPAGSPYSRVGVELTDSPYVAANLRIMTRMGRVALEHLGDVGQLRARASTASATCRPSAASSSTSPRRERSGASARATAATRC